MTKSKRIFFILILIAVAATAFIIMKTKNKVPDEVTQEISPVIGNIQMSITSTATVQPQNRLEIKPPINGRVDKILVSEGNIVKKGQVLVLMSSTERAALLDAAQIQGEETIKYWEDVYKPTPLLSPIDAEVIVSKDYPGQIVTTADVVVVLSDHLIVQAQVDETDIGKIKLGQEVTLSLDAYPQIKVKGKVNHIYYESLIVNNVTIYQVDIVPDEVPPIFRSGMSATVDIVEEAKDNVLTLPAAAVKRNAEGAYVLINRGEKEKPEEHKINVGISDDKNTEILSGLTTGDKVMMVSQKYKASSGKSGGTNPLNPMTRRR